MARYTGPRARVCRRLEFPVFESPKFGNPRKNYPPGQHGNSRRRKLSNYGIQLREKQRIKYLYGLLERQFRNYYKAAASSRGETGTNLLQFLEARLDNVVYRMGFAATRAEARQLVNHKSVLVNGKKVNIPSYQVAEGDEISISEKSRNQKRISQSFEIFKTREPCEWIEVNHDNFSGIYKNTPDRDLLSSEINESFIVELYSR